MVTDNAMRPGMESLLRSPPSDPCDLRFYFTHHRVLVFTSNKYNLFLYQSPIPKRCWADVWNATYPQNQCVQRDFLTEEISGSEDCLYLNVYRPDLTTQKRLLPVAVFIHGGGFSSGSSDPGIYGPDYFMDTREVVMVTIQYRLGVFGFLAANDKSCKGNYGLKDQSLALRWIQKNIGAFGGDNQQVTVIGSDSGAASIQYQMLSRRSNAFFHRAVLMSGSALAYWAVNRKPVSQFRRYAAIAGIPGAEDDDPSEIVRELRTRTAYELFSFQELITYPLAFVSPFRPVVEGHWSGAFITQQPEQIWKSGRYQQRPFLIGTTGYEEGYLADFYYNQTQRPELLANWKGFMSQLLDYPESVLNPTFRFYFDGKPTEENAMNLLRFRVDSVDYPMYKTVEYYTRYADLRRNPVDQYNFNFTSSSSFSVLSSAYPVDGRGASHGDDLLYLFPMEKIQSLLFREAPEVEMKDYWVRFLVDYAIYGRTFMTTRRCRRSDMMRGNCEFTDIQRDFSKTPNTVRISTSDKIDLAEVKAHKAVDYLLRSYV